MSKKIEIALSREFAVVADAYVAAQTQMDALAGASGTWGGLVVYAVSMKADADTVGTHMRGQEGAYKVAKKVESMPTSYRSAKSVVLAALKNGIALVDDNGNVLGKTAVEKAIASKREAEGDASTKSEIAKFQSTMATASAIFAKITEAGDIATAKALVQALAKDVLKAEKALKDAA